MLASLLTAELFAPLLVFVRVGAAFMIMPGYGEPFISPRVRLIMALLVALVVTPIVAEGLPAMPASALMLAVLVMGEAVVGFFLGTIARLFMSALTTAGMLIAYMSAMANALTNDPSAAQQGSIAGSFLNLVALMVIVGLNLHHMLLMAVIDSYQLFVPGQALPVGEFSDMVAQVVAKVFLLSIQIATPFVAVGMTFYLGVGLLSRLMPQIQVFFVAMPLQIAMGMMMLGLSIPIAMRWFITNFEETLSVFVAGV
jgi:flagellar biosynthetic protein FliR